MPTYRLLVEYDGSKFSGWQILPHGRTVQGVLLEALRKVTGQRELHIFGAGRTDAGVHALGQVASFHTRRSLAVAEVLQALQRILPADVSVLDLRLAAPGFHARHDATGRAYRYQLALRRSAFGKRYSWWVEAPLNLQAMTEAAQALVGRHDFGPFSRRVKEQKSTLVEVEEVRVVEVGGVVLIRVVASHFLWNQMRRMVGVLVEVGRGALRPQEVRQLLRGEKALPPVAAPAAGLFLEAVRYPQEPFPLPPLLPVGLPPWGLAVPVATLAQEEAP
ncbi:MAG: tRNA pseudouridine(38-40) synthase TruA [Thermoanaerobaculum sp.]|nr:tRNA pseudouridine(38-40) synthase TruA [Thermoanaerobaculum sp.]MDW7968099.1 tRNA pseudouridine(38-40) synthase TruA [Thermoanaerobaculum sp.]